MTSSTCTFTILFKGSNLNYGESVGNILSLKRLTHNGKSYSYISRQALRYDIVRLMNEQSNVPLTPVNREKGVIQFDPAAKIDQYPEIDFFGYMKTSKAKGTPTDDGEESDGKTDIRKAVVRLSDAISLEPYKNDLELGNNMGLASGTRQKDGKSLQNDLFNAEVHKSFYSYTVTIDLAKVGVDGDKQLSKAEKLSRIEALFDAIRNLYRDIRGKREDLSPLFIVGGVYPVGSPLFYHLIQVEPSTQSIDLSALTGEFGVLNRKLPGQPNTVKAFTLIGKAGLSFGIPDTIEGINVQSIDAVFAALLNKIDAAL